MLFDNYTFYKLIHPKNIYFPKYTTESGIVTV